MKHKHHYTILMDLTITEGYQTDAIEKLMRDAAALIADGMQAKVTASLLCSAGSKKPMEYLPLPAGRIMSQAEMEQVARKAKMEAAGYSPSRPDTN